MNSDLLLEFNVNLFCNGSHSNRNDETHEHNGENKHVQLICRLNLLQWKIFRADDLDFADDICS